MGSDDQVVSVDRQVAHGGMGKIQLQRLPVIAIVEGYVNGSLAPGEKQAFANGIFAHHVGCGVSRQTFIDFLPGFAKVAGAVNVRVQVIETERIDGRVSGAGGVVASFDYGNFAPGGQLGRGDVLPGLPCVAGDVDQAIISAGPNCILLL